MIAKSLLACEFNMPKHEISEKRIRVPDSAKRKNWPITDLAHVLQFTIRTQPPKPEQARLRIENAVYVRVFSLNRNSVELS